MEISNSYSLLIQFQLKVFQWHVALSYIYIYIDSSHMSGPYGGALFSTSAYDGNDSMFPLAFGVVGSKNYED